MVVTAKLGEKIQLCWNYKVIVNHYLFPKPGELFNLLNGVNKFAKLSLTNMHLQVLLNKEANHKGFFPVYAASACSVGSCDFSTGSRNINA